MLLNVLKIIVLPLLVACSFSVCAANVEVFVSILPQQYFVERIGADRVNVNVMVKPGHSPETFEPSPKLMSSYSKADVYFTIGMPFEQVWIDRVASLNIDMLVVDTQASLQSKKNGPKVLLPEQHGHDEQPIDDKMSYNSGVHSKGSPNWDPHTWLSPVLAVEQAKIIVRELSRLSPKDEDYFYNNFNILKKELNVLHNEFLGRFQHTAKHNFVTFHPAFSYFAQQYGLTQLAIEIDGKEPSAKQIAQIVNRIRDKNVAFILIEKQFNQLIPMTIAKSVGAQLLVLDPLALDYLSNMRDIADKIHRSLF